MIKLSIVVPVFNVEKYIDKCLNSLVNQTLEDLEIIIINDGSKDNSKDIIQKYLRQYPTKIKYYEKENGGLSSARNYGMKYATGEYIAFLDADDYIEFNMYEQMYNLAEKENADMCECDFIWEWESGKIKYDKRRNYKSKREMMKKPRVVVWNKIIKREIIEKNNIQFPQGLVYEDIEFFYKLMPFVNKISYINKCFVHYIQRKNSISNAQTEKIADVFEILKNIIEFYKNNNLYKQYKQELRYMCKRILFGSSMKRILKIKDGHLKRKLFLKTIIFFLKKGTDFNKKEPSPIKKKKICFGITKLGIGGAERVLVDIVNELEHDYNISIFIIYGGGELEKEVNENVQIIRLYDEEFKNIFISLYILLFGKHIYNKYMKGKNDIDIAFLEGPITRIFSYKGNEKKIAWVHNDIAKVFGNSIESKFKNYMDKWFYKKYNQIIFVSDQNKREFEKTYGNISNRTVIYNYINKNRIIEMCKRKPVQNQLEILTVSRLVKQKGIDRFIRVHKRLLDDGLIHKVYVIGDGEEKENLLNITKKLNVEKSFIFLGKKENPYPYIKTCKYFALLSYYEGYGIVIEETKILNKPIIITNTAAVEAVRDYDRKLIIANDEESIYEEMKNVLIGKYEYLDSESFDQEYIYENKCLIQEIKNILN